MCSEGARNRTDHASDAETVREVQGGRERKRGGGGRERRKEKKRGLKEGKEKRKERTEEGGKRELLSCSLP